MVSQELGGGGMVQSVFRGAVRLAVLLVATTGAAQTFDVNGQTSPTSPVPSKKRSAPSNNKPSDHNETGMGWGASIQVARTARKPRRARYNTETRKAQLRMPSAR